MSHLPPQQPLQVPLALQSLQQLLVPPPRCRCRMTVRARMMTMASSMYEAMFMVYKIADEMLYMMNEAA